MMQMGSDEINSDPQINCDKGAFPPKATWFLVSKEVFSYHLVAVATN